MAKILFSVLLLFSQRLYCQDSVLHTGWYFLVDTNTGFERRISTTQKDHFINPIPIVTANEFTTLKIYRTHQGTYGLMMKLTDSAAIAWKWATQISVGKRLGFILDNKLLSDPFVNESISGGITALNTDDYSEAELEKFKRMIENEE
jgi:preprotein translocase subunit SecD